MASDSDVVMTDSDMASSTGAATAATSLTSRSNTADTSLDTNMTDSKPSISSSSSTSHRTDHDRLFFLPSTANPLKRSRPHPSQNLIADYGLDSVHNRVRRVDPSTGDKINKLRKSYVGIVKNMHLAGSNKEVPTPGQWLDTVRIHDPVGIMDKKVEETGEVDIVDGMQIPRTVERWKVDVPPVSGERKSALLAKLGRAVQMAPGKLEDGEKWRKLLGDDAVKKPAVSLVPSALKQAGIVGASSARPSPKLGPAAGRTQRQGAKRSYDEASFSGYNETYEDVDRVAQSSSAEAAMRKKQRKVQHDPSPTPEPESELEPEPTPQRKKIALKGPKEYVPPPSKWKTWVTRTKAKR